MRGRLALLAYRCGLGKPIGHRGRKAISSVWRDSPLRRASCLSLRKKISAQGGVSNGTSKAVCQVFLLRCPIHPSPARPWVQLPQVNFVTLRNARYGRYTTALPHISGTGLLGQAPSIELQSLSGWRRDRKAAIYCDWYVQLSLLANGNVSWIDISYVCCYF